MDSGIVARHARRKIIISLTLLLVLLTTANSLASEFKAQVGSGDDIVEINLAGAVNRDRGSLLLYQDLDAIRRLFPKGEVSYVSEMDSVLFHNGIALPVKACLTGEAYPAFSGLNISAGSYFGADAARYGRNVAVISEDLAARLFMSLDAVGSEVELSGESYMIVGLYRQRATIASFLGSDGYGRVYIPFTSSRSMDELPVNTVAIRDKSLIEEKFKQDTIGGKLRKEIGIDPAAYRIIDYYRSDVAVSQWHGLFLFIAALWTGILLLRCAAGVWARYAPRIRSGLEDYYFFELIRKRAASIAAFAGALLFLAACAALVVAVSWPGLHISAQFIPQDNVFDLKFYFDRIREAINTSNAVRDYVPTPLERTFNTTSSLNALLSLFMIPALISLNSGVRLLYAAGGSLKDFMKALGLSLAAVALSCVLLAASGAIDPVIPVREIAVIAAFLAARAVVKPR